MAKKQLECDLLSAEEVKNTDQPEFAAHDWSRSGMCNPLFSMAPGDFSGVARTVECFNNQGHNNFRILTLYIEKGKIVKIDVSDPYANWEAGQKLDHWNNLSLINLNNNWKHGKALCK
jgi:hypothetical protein